MFLLLVCMMGILLVASASASDLNETTVSQTDDETISVEEIDDVSQNLTGDKTVENEKLSADNDSEVLESTHYASDFNDLKSKVSSANDGDTIVLSGSYSFASQIAVNKKLTFIGTNNAVLDGRKSNRFFTTNADGVSFINITFQNGKSNDANGGAIYANNGISIDNCRFINNYAGWSSGAVRVENDAFYNITNSYFEGNNGDHGGAISIISSNGLVYNCTFYKNIGRRSAAASECGNFEKCRFIENKVNDGNGGAIDMWCSYICTITNCSFIRNAATNEGGALCLNSNGHVYDCYFEENSAKYNGGAINGGNIENCTFIKNHANFGGAICAASVINSLFVDNYGEHGGAIHIRDVSGKIIGNCSFENSHSEYYGGAIDIYNVQNINISNCNFTNCYCNNNMGGAIACEKVNNMNISGCSFEYCHSKEGGGALRLDASSNVYVGSSDFIDNYADYGGAIRFGSFNGVYPSEVIIDACNFKNNTAAYFGGAIDGVSVTNWYISGCNFTDCSAEGNEGGAISADSPNNLNILDCSFDSCHSKELGGAIRAEGSDGVHIEDSDFANCHSNKGGSIEIGIINNKGSSNVDVSKCSFINSSANNGGSIHTDTASHINMTDLTFKNCYSSEGSSCIDAYNTDDVAVNGCNLGDCSSLYGAIGLFGTVNSVDITECSFNNCSSVNDGAAVYWNNGNSLKIDDCNFTECVSENGGNSIKLNSGTSGYSVDNCIFDVAPEGIDYYYDSYLDVNSLSVVQGDDVILSGRLYNILNPLGGKKITFKINGEEYNKTTFSDGSFEFNIKDYLHDLGQYDISVDWTGEGVFKSVSNVSSVRINSYMGNLTVNQTGKYYGDTWLNFKLINSRTEIPISYESIKLVFSNGKTASLTTDEMGLCSYNIPFAPGSYNVTAYVGRENVDVNVIELNNISINKIIGEIEITQVGDSRALTIRLFNPNNGDVYRNIEVSLEFSPNSAYADLKTNDEGIATYHMPFDIRTYSVVGKVTGDYKEFANGELKGIRITADSGSSDEDASQITFGNDISFDYLKSGSTTFATVGCSIQSSNITVLDHPEIKPKLSGNKITVSGLNVGTYTLRVITTPNEGYYSVIGTAKITVKKVSAKISVKKISLYHKEGKKWTIKLIDTKTGKGIANMVIKLKVFTGKNSKSYSVKTNSKGVATFKNLKKLSVGKHKVTLSFSKYGYNCKSVTTTVKVLKQTKVKYKVKSVPQPDGTSVSIWIKIGKKPIKNGVKFNIYVPKRKKPITVVTGTFKKGNEVNKGFVGYGTNLLSAGTHKITIKPVGFKYTGSKTIKIKIKKGTNKYRKSETIISKGKKAEITHE